MWPKFLSTKGVSQRDRLDALQRFLEKERPRIEYRMPEDVRKELQRSHTLGTVPLAEETEPGMSEDYQEILGEREPKKILRFSPTYDLWNPDVLSCAPFFHVVPVPSSEASSLLCHLPESAYTWVFFLNERENKTKEFLFAIIDDTWRNANNEELFARHPAIYHAVKLEYPNAFPFLAGEALKTSTEISINLLSGSLMLPIIEKMASVISSEEKGTDTIEHTQRDFWKPLALYLWNWMISGCAEETVIEFDDNKRSILFRKIPTIEEAKRRLCAAPARCSPRNAELWKKWVNDVVVTEGRYDSWSPIPKMHRLCSGDPYTREEKEVKVEKPKARMANLGTRPMSSIPWPVQGTIPLALPSSIPWHLQKSIPRPRPGTIPRPRRPGTIPRALPTLSSQGPMSKTWLAFAV